MTGGSGWREWPLDLKAKHGDPFDRLPCAQAHTGRMKLLNLGDKGPKSGAAVIRA
jgi:PIN domain nuclease of toxin-antitoxin system